MTEHFRIHTTNQIRHVPIKWVCSQGHTTSVNLLKLHTFFYSSLNTEDITFKPARSEFLAVVFDNVVPPPK